METREQQLSSTWQLDPRRAPAMEVGDDLIHDEHGRVLQHSSGHGVDCRSHWFRLVRNCGALYLLVQHGAGEERIRLASSFNAHLLDIMRMCTSDQRYALMHTLMNTNHDADRYGRDSTWHNVKVAYLQNRLKKRKVRGTNEHRVWIESPAQ